MATSTFDRPLEITNEEDAQRLWDFLYEYTPDVLLSYEEIDEVFEELKKSGKPHTTEEFDQKCREMLSR